MLLDKGCVSPALVELCTFWTSMKLHVVRHYPKMNPDSLNEINLEFGQINNPTSSNDWNVTYYMS